MNGFDLPHFKKSPLWLGLNSHQQKAVSLPNEHALILAGAGTGKTKTLVARISALLQDGIVKSHEILAVTFTNKSAGEMRHRVEKAVGAALAQSLEIGTFHGMAYRWLRNDWAGFGFKPNATLLDADDQKALFRRLFKDRGWDEKKFPIRESLGFINSQKEEGLRPAQVVLKSSLQAPLLEFYKAYEQQLKDENALDFAELLLAVRDRLRDDPEFFSKMSGRWKIILVDEFQDTNPLQYDLLERLIKKGGSLFAVGDDDQSIYGFRGARVKNLFDFAQNYAQDRVVRLEENYRSSKNILDAANAVIQQNDQRMGKELWTQKEAGAPIRIRKVDHEHEEADETVGEVRQLLNQGTPPNEIAILYRSNAQSRLFEQVCLHRKVPYQIVGGLRFFERAEVKDALAHLRSAVSPDDIGAFCRAVTKPSFGIGAKRIESWRLKSQKPGCGFFDIVQEAASPADGKGDAAAKKWVDHIERGQLLLKNKGWAAGFAEWIDEMELKKAYSSDERKEERLENIDELVNAIAEFESENAGGSLSLADFLADAVLNSEQVVGSPGIQLSTIHAAKGLEFDAVFWVGLEEGLTPHARAIEEEGGLEEECRLAYVAMTRAKKHLTLSFASQRFFQGSRMESEPSRYLGSVPEGIVQALNTRWPPTPRPAFWSENRTSKMSVSIEKPLSREERAPLPVQFHSLTSKNKSTVVQDDSQDGNWEKGQTVYHPRFGRGVIQEVSNQTNLVEVRVRFKEGERRLIAKFAQLKRVP